MKPIHRPFSKTIFKVALLAVLLFSFSCSQDSSPEDLNPVYAKVKKSRPIKANLDFIFDYQNTAPQNIVLCPGTPEPPPGQNPIALFQTIVSGNMSHLGNLQPGFEFDDANNVPLSGSYLIPKSCDATTTFPTLVTTYTSVYVAANGDELHALEEVFINFATGTFEGTAVVQKDEGSGRFTNATGTWKLINGTFDPVGASWEIAGEITY